MVFGISDRGIEKILQTLDKIVPNPDELEHWIRSIEATVKMINHDKLGQVCFEYYPEERIVNFFVKNAKARDNLVNAVEVHLPLIPESLQGFFTVFKYNLKNAKIAK